MKLRSKILALFLCVLCTAGMLTLPVGNRTVQAAAADYEEQLTLLNSLNIVSVTMDTLKERSAVDREEFLAGVLALLNIDMASADILETSAQLGIINRATMDEYGLESRVTYDQAFKMFSAALGYDLIAQMQGGYPVGYGLTASMTGVRNGISGSGETNITQGDFVQMLYNALFASRLESDYNPDDPFRYVDRTPIITKIFRVYKIEGTVQQTPLTGLYSVDGLEKDQVVIDDEYYAINGTKAADLLGYWVTAYVKDDPNTDPDNLLYIGKKRDRAMRIEGEDLVSVSSDVREIRYQQDSDSMRTVRIDPGASIIYNNKLCLNYTQEDFNIRSGYIELIDREDNGSYDLVKVYSYDVMVADTVIYSQRKVKSLYADIATSLGHGLAEVELDERSNDYDINIHLNDGTALGLRDLQKMDVLNVLRSKPDGTHTPLVDVTVCRDTFSGTLDASNEEYLIVDGMEYKCTEEFGIYMMGTPNNEKLTYNRYYNFYLDVDGKIAGAEAADGLTASQEKYVYLKTTGQESIFQYKALYMDTEGSWHEAPLAESLRYNDQKRGADEVAELLRNAEQVVKLRVNAEGTIVSLRTATQTSISDKSSFTVKNVTGYFRSGMYSLSSQLYMEESATIFVVPADLSTAKLKDYSVVTRTWFRGGTSYTVNAYDFDEFNFANIFTVTSDVKSVVQKSSIFIVKEVLEAVNDDDEPVVAISGAQGAYASIMLVSENDADLQERMRAVRPGDVVYLNQNQRGEVANIETVYSLSDGISYKTLNDGAQYSVAAGIISKVDASRRRMNLEIDGTTQPILLNTSVMPYIYNETSETVSKGALSELAEGDYTLVFTNYANIQAIVTYRK